MAGEGAIMDSGSAEYVATESLAKNVPLMETEASRQGQTYYISDGGVIKNIGEQKVAMYSETGDQYRARHQITDVTRPRKQCAVHADWRLDHQSCDWSVYVVPSGTRSVRASLMDK